jgi:metal iron transporter
MDCPSRTDDVLPHPTWNQSPPELAADTTTRRDLKGAAIPKDEIELDTITSVKHVPAFENAVEAPPDPNPPHASCLSRTLFTFRTFTSFIGPGFLISVAYIDPGNYATDVAAGASTKFALLFVVLMSNLFAIFLQSLSIKLGSVTGLNLAENCRKHAPRWCTIVLYVISEVAIVATDIAEVSWNYGWVVDGEDVLTGCRLLGRRLR